MKVFGLDIGDKRIGIAVSNALRCTAQGLTVSNETLLKLFFNQNLCHEFRDW